MTAVDGEMAWLLGGVLAVLIVATAVGQVLRRRVCSERGRARVENLNARIKAWWVICALLGATVVTGGWLSVALFAVASFLALREFLALAPARAADHSVLLWCFYAILPLQFLLVAGGWFALFSILIPVVAFLIIPTRNALSGNCERFLERTALLQWGLMVCVYNISFAPALLRLEMPDPSATTKLLLFLVIVVQASDVLQYVWGTLIGRRRIAPRISPNKTWEGFLGGVACATLVGAALWWVTPFSVAQAALLSLGIALLGFAGGLTMSAIKRDRGVKDYGNLIRGHGGVLDRLDSLCFAAPLFYYATRFLVG